MFAVPDVYVVESAPAAVSTTTMINAESITEQDMNIRWFAGSPATVRFVKTMFWQ